MDARNWRLLVSSCLGKQAFSTPQLAKKMMRRRARMNGITRDRKESRGLHTYRCKCCGLFHIGRTAKSRQTTISRRWTFGAYQMEDDEA